MAFSSLHLRLLSGFTLGPIFVVCLYLGGFPFLMVIGLAFGLSVREWMGMARKSPKFYRDAMIGLLYFTISYYTFLKLRIDFELGAALTIALFGSVMASDIGAYFAGKAYGGAKLLPVISPNKTWAGFIGAVLSSALMLLVVNLTLPFLKQEAFLSVPEAIGIGAAIGVAGQVGDLLISLYKRRVGVKDTGNLIPGHGGLLDRIDSLLLASPLFFVIMAELSHGS